jgi:hypothetical protein
VNLIYHIPKTLGQCQGLSITFGQNMVKQVKILGEKDHCRFQVQVIHVIDKLHRPAATVYFDDICRQKPRNEQEVFAFIEALSR